MKWCLGLLSGSSGESYTERRKKIIQESKYLGGDMEHTHLVKGLDFALLEKVIITQTFHFCFSISKLSIHSDFSNSNHSVQISNSNLHSIFNFLIRFPNFRKFNFQEFQFLQFRSIQFKSLHSNFQFISIHHFSNSYISKFSWVPISSVLISSVSFSAVPISPIRIPFLHDNRLSNPYFETIIRFTRYFVLSKLHSAHTFMLSAIWLSVALAIRHQNHRNRFP